MNRIVFALAISLFLLSNVSAQDSVDPSSVLKRLVGNWRTEITSKPAEWTPEGRTVTGEITIKLILNDRFIEETGKSLGEDTQHRVLWGYDPRRQVFRSWFFDSHGTAIDWDGKWNERTRTMVWERELPDGITSNAEHRFIDADHYEWKSIAKDKTGKVYLDMHGKHTRVKAK